jgi:hypothetical protein
MGMPEPSSFHQAVGRAIEAYSRVEAEEAFLLRAILKTDIRTAYMVCFAVQNTRSRVELIEGLLKYKFSNNFEAYWASCSKFIATLTQFRNALAHWHLYWNVYTNHDESEFRYSLSLGPPVPSGKKSILESDIPLFLKDCENISEALRDLSKFIANRRKALPQRFQKPIACQNQADLQPPPSAKAPQPQRKPSVPKLSRAQKRKKALKDARKKK